MKEYKVIYANNLGTTSLEEFLNEMASENWIAKFAVCDGVIVLEKEVTNNGVG